MSNLQRRMVGLVGAATGGLLAAAFMSAGAANAADSFAYVPDINTFSSTGGLNLAPILTLGPGALDYNIVDISNPALSSADSIAGVDTIFALGPLPFGLDIDFFNSIGGYFNSAGYLEPGAAIDYIGFPALNLANELVMPDGTLDFNMFDVIMTPLGFFDIPL